ncbi:hypothetical protein lbkm_3108 [Lachnospiraceae bacterium KM106-2]|nr:hypothetical protein lbkm_3108 [Lachnospiraceae bacterium KM106-2]
MQPRKRLINWLGLLGVVSFISYMAAVIFAPLAYPGYDWMRQAVSDLSADNAPSLNLWNQLSCLYSVCAIVSIMMVCVYIQGRLNKTIRVGIYLFAAMNWVSDVGYGLFPLSKAGYAGTFQDIMHTYVVTVGVVLLAILSLVLIIIGGCKEKAYKALAIWAAIILGFMFVGAIGGNLAVNGILPKSCFGILERFSTCSATAFNAVLGTYLFIRGYGRKNEKTIQTTAKGKR